MASRKKLLWVAASVAGILAVISTADSRGFRQYLKLQRDMGAMTERNRQLADENRALMREIEALRTDPKTLERAAREELGYIKPGEIVIHLE